MPPQNAINLKVVNNADGFEVSGGTTARKLTLSGGDVAVAGAGANVYTFQNASGILAFTTDAVKTHCVLYMDLLALNGAGVLANRPFQNETVTTFAAQPDVPRQITVRTTPNGTMTGTVTINGIDANGATIQDIFTINEAAPVTHTSNYAYALVTSVVVVKTDANALESYSVGWNDVAGLPNYPFNATGDVFKTKKNNANVTVPTVNATYGTVNLATITGGDDWTFFYRPFKA